jgi:hypothetical protein
MLLRILALWWSANTPTPGLYLLRYSPNTPRECSSS